MGRVGGVLHNAGGFTVVLGTASGMEGRETQIVFPAVWVLLTIDVVLVDKARSYTTVHPQELNVAESLHA